MKRFADYKGKEPEELFIAITADGFRIYVSEQQAIRWVNKALAENQEARLVRYSKNNENN